MPSLFALLMRFWLYVRLASFVSLRCWWTRCDDAWSPPRQLCFACRPRPSNGEGPRSSQVLNLPNIDPQGAQSIHHLRALHTS